jgi:hypothetical protein
MIISDSPERNTSLTVDVVRYVTYQEDFELNLLFSTLNNTQWSKEDYGFDFIQLSSNDAAAILHVKELLEYSNSDTIMAYLDDSRIEVGVSFTEGRVYLNIDLDMSDMEVTDEETNIEIS